MTSGTKLGLCPVHNGRGEMVNYTELSLFIFSCNMKDDYLKLPLHISVGHRENLEISHCGSSVYDDQVCPLCSRMSSVTLFILSTLT